MKNIFLLGVFALAFSLSACLKDLDREPLYETTSAKVFSDPANYEGLVAKLYAGLAVSGQQGPAGKPDIQGIDEGFSSYLRQYWKAQELPTDEAVIGWNDGALPDYHDMDWTPNNEFITAMYNRIFYQVGLCNEFLRQTTDAKMKDRGITVPELAAYRAEARFLRALSYSHAIDLFGSVPFVVETDAIGAFLPKQATRAELFNYVESELIALESILPAAKTNAYGRADQAAVWMLLSRMYLNAEVYLATPKFTECITYCKKVIDAGYSLEPEYQHLFLTENNLSNEMIFPVTFDGIRTKTWGGMTFLVHAGVGGSMVAADYGINGGWGGLRATRQMVEKFDDPTGASDQRALFYSSGQNLDVNDIFSFKEGYAITKYRNVNKNGQKGSDVEGNFPDTDYPMFRLADAYLMYAEAVLRNGSGGDLNTAIGYVNQIRERAYGDNSGNVTTIDLPFILDERARELYWEGVRRTDLIRFNQFTSSSYLWNFKGGVQEGRGVEDWRVLFPIPFSDMTANPNLIQNPGYN